MALRELMGDLKPADPRKRTISTMHGMVTEIADYRNGLNALGYSFKFYEADMLGGGGVKLLEIDGSAPSLENIESGKYPLSVGIYAVTVEKDPASQTRRDANAQKLVDWIVSPQGQELVKKTGFAPLEG